MRERSQPRPILRDLLRAAALLLGILVAGGAVGFSQEAAPADPKAPGARITFLPPPMRGTVSLGVYGRGSKLVRVLRREADPEKAFTVGLNGLILQWDGKDEAGKSAPPGKYTVKGFCVGRIEVSGEAFHCNDWVEAEDSPHIREITGIAMIGAEQLRIYAKTADDSATYFDASTAGKLLPLSSENDPGAGDLPEDKARILESIGSGPASIVEGRLAPASQGGAPLPDAHRILDFCRGTDGGVWLVDQAGEHGEAEVRQFSAAGEFLRRLPPEPGEPQPAKVAASPDGSFLALLETGPGVQRLRGFALETPAAPAGADAPAQSQWRTVFTKTIRPAADFAAAAPYVGRPVKREARVSVKLAPNPLIKGGASSAELSVGIEETGSFLYTADGLPLCRLTDTSLLKWGVLIRESSAKQLTLFQSDGAVVEEYRLSGLPNMMAFDAGEYEVK